MSTTALSEFYLVARQNETLQKRLEGFDSVEDYIRKVVELGAKQGYFFTIEDVKTAWQNPANFLDLALKEVDELSDAELEIVAGGQTSVTQGGGGEANAETNNPLGTQKF